MEFATSEYFKQIREQVDDDGNDYNDFSGKPKIFF